MPGQHDKKTLLLKQLSKAIFSESLDDKKKLKERVWVN